MADTVHFISWVDPSIPTATLFQWRLPFKIGRHGDQDDFFPGFGPDGMKPPAGTHPKSAPIFQEWMTLTSRTGAGFKARGVWDPSEQARLGGYEIKMNVPTCMVGHNVLLDNSVARAGELALLQFKLLLLEKVTHPAALDAFDPERIELLSVTPTECYRGSTRDGAHRGRMGFKALSELRNHGGRQDQRNKPAFSVGPGDGQTSYLKTRELSNCCYVKDRNAPSHARFPSLDLRGAIFDEGETLTRLEGESTKTLLKKLGATSLESWRRYGSDQMYQAYSAALRKLVGLDTELRARRPKPEQIAALAEPDRSMVLMHLEGQDARLHPAVLAHPTELDQQKYYSAVKSRVLSRLRINLSIPWKKQVGVCPWTDHGLHLTYQANKHRRRATVILGHDWYPIVPKRAKNPHPVDVPLRRGKGLHGVKKYINVGAVPRAIYDRTELLLFFNLKPDFRPPGADSVGAFNPPGLDCMRGFEAVMGALRQNLDEVSLISYGSPAWEILRNRVDGLHRPQGILAQARSNPSGVPLKLSLGTFSIPYLPLAHPCDRRNFNSEHAAYAARGFTELNLGGAAPPI